MLVPQFLKTLKTEITIFPSAAGMTVEILPFPFCGEVIAGDDFAKILYETPKAKEALAEVIPWLDSQGAFDLPQ